MSSRWNGADKYRTKDCDGCPYLAAGKEADRFRALVAGNVGEEFCLWGAAWKILFPPERRAPRACAERKRPA